MFNLRGHIKDEERGLSKDSPQEVIDRLRHHLHTMEQTFLMLGATR